MGPTAIALHEGAHAAAAALSGAGLESVELHSRGGRTKALTRFASDDVRFKVLTVAALAPALLGAVSDAEAVAMAEADLAEAAPLTARLGGAAYARRTMRWAGRWIREHEAGIRAIAQVLDKRRRLSGDEVRTLLALPIAVRSPGPRALRRPPMVADMTPAPKAKPKSAYRRILKPEPAAVIRVLPAPKPKRDRVAKVTRAILRGQANGTLR